MADGQFGQGRIEVVPIDHLETPVQRLETALVAFRFGVARHRATDAQGEVRMGVLIVGEKEGRVAAVFECEDFFADLEAVLELAKSQPK